jgi:death on curing protein
VFYLTSEDVIDLYIHNVGPRDALTRPDLLDSAVALPQATMFGDELYPHIFQKAAALLRSIAQNQALMETSESLGSRHESF